MVLSICIFIHCSLMNRQGTYEGVKVMDGEVRKAAEKKVVGVCFVLCCLDNSLGFLSNIQLEVFDRH